MQTAIKTDYEHVPDVSPQLDEMCNLMMQLEDSPGGSEKLAYLKRFALELLATNGRRKEACRHTWREDDDATGCLHEDFCNLVNEIERLPEDEQEPRLARIRAALKSC